MNIAVVEWFDAQTTRKEYPPSSCPIMVSIGRVTTFNDRVVVEHLITPDNDISNGIHTTIPIGCVKSIKRVLCKKSASTT